MAKFIFLPAGLFLVSITAMPALAAAEDAADPAMVASRAPTPLQEPHAVDKPASATVQQAPEVPKPRARPAPAVAATAVKSKPKSVPAKPQVTAKAKAAPVPARKLAHRSARHPRAFAEAPRVRDRRVPMTREARRDFEERREYRPPSGPVYPVPPMAGAAPGCDEACQYRDWLNRYAAWYRDFGRYYYGAPPRPALPPGPIPPPAIYGENRPMPAAPIQAYGRAESERDRLDPWHGYNSHSPDNGY